MDSAIKFNQNAWLKSYIDINIELREKAKNDFGIFGFAVFEKCDRKQEATKARKNYNQNQTIIQQFFFRKRISQRNNKTQIFMNKPLYLGLYTITANSNSVSILIM